MAGAPVSVEGESSAPEVSMVTAASVESVCGGQCIICVIN